jgi:hypothetical protein
VAKTGVFPNWLVVAGFVVAALGFFGESTPPLLDQGIGLSRLRICNDSRADGPCRAEDGRRRRPPAGRP